MDAQQHWETLYAMKAPDQVSWFRPHLETSLTLLERATRGNRAASIIDIGGGASTLVDDLIEGGYKIGCGGQTVKHWLAALGVARNQMFIHGRADRSTGPAARPMLPLNISSSPALTC